MTKTSRFLLAALASSSLYAADPYSVQVTASRELDGIVYRYVITNNSGAPAMRFTLGAAPYPAFPGEDLTQLVLEPVGFSIGECGEVGCVYHVPVSSVSYPQDWEFNFTTIEEQTGHKMIELSTENEEPYVLSKSEMLEFSIKLPKPDITYANSGFKVEWGNISYYQMGHYYGHMRPLDIAAPQFTLTMQPTVVATAAEWVEVVADWSVSDETDSTPDVFLENIECLTPAVEFRRAERAAQGLGNGEVPGSTCRSKIAEAAFGTSDKRFKLSSTLLDGETERVYWVSYAAYDATGNKTVHKLPITIQAGSPAPLLGDLNADNCIDIGDMSLLLKAIRERSTDAKYDINRDGVINNSDRSSLQSLYSNSSGAACP